MAKAFLPLLAEREGSSYLFITGSLGERKNVELSMVSDSTLLSVVMATLYSAIHVLQFEWQDKPVRINEFRIGMRVVHDEQADPAGQPYPSYPANDFGRIIAGMGLASELRAQTVSCAQPQYKEVLDKYGV